MSSQMSDFGLFTWLNTLQSFKLKSLTFSSFCAISLWQVATLLAYLKMAVVVTTYKHGIH